MGQIAQRHQRINYTPCQISDNIGVHLVADELLPITGEEALKKAKKNCLASRSDYLKLL
ncbi:MAG: hypothetical protein ACYTBV_07140 [Planctomycetota bacterium]|jgi:hypothetical protein